MAVENFMVAAPEELRVPEVHVIDPKALNASALADVASKLGYDAHVYAGIEELLADRPNCGMLFVSEDALSSDPSQTLAWIDELPEWLPVVVTAAEPHVEAVVAAIKAGALDFLALPATPGSFRELLDRISDESEVHSCAKRRVTEARQKIDKLTPRELEVLDWLTEGRTNKEIAREFGISPRTVEIHRARVLAKLDARNVVEAVRLRLELGELAH